MPDLPRRGYSLFLSDFLFFFFFCFFCGSPPQAEIDTLRWSADPPALKHKILVATGHALLHGCAAAVLFAAAAAAIERGWLATSARLLSSVRRPFHHLPASPSAA